MPENNPNKGLPSGQPLIGMLSVMLVGGISQLVGYPIYGHVSL